MTRQSYQQGYVSEPIRTRRGIIFKIRYRVPIGRRQVEAEVRNALRPFRQEGRKGGFGPAASRTLRNPSGNAQS